MTPARWRWQLVDGTGAVLEDNLGPGFGSRFDAESWLGERWRSVAAEAGEPRGLAAQLFRDDHPVGPPVLLRDPEA